MSYQQGSKKPGAAPYPQQQYHPPPQYGRAPYPSYPPNPTANPPNIGFAPNMPMQMPQPLSIPVYVPAPSNITYPPPHNTSGGGYLPTGGYPPQPPTNYGPPQKMPQPLNIPTYVPTAPPPIPSRSIPSGGGYSQPTGGYPPSTNSYNYPPQHSPAFYPSRTAPGAPLGERGGSYGYGGPYQPPKRTPTVRPSASFNSIQDGATLRAAMKGWGCDDKALINVLAHRSNAQRLQIAKDYKIQYGRDLTEDLISETKGNLETLLVAMVTPLPVYYAKELHHAMEGLGTTESTLIEILSSKSNAEIMTIRNAYYALYKKSLEDDLRDDTSGHFRRLMMSLCNAGRDESMVSNQVAAQKDAADLLAAGVAKWGTDESTFNMVLCQRNWAQLQLVFQEYQKIAGHDIEQAIKQEFSGDIERGLLAVVRFIKNQAGFFAQCLNESMKGLGTRDRALIRLVVTRSEIDMVEIKREYEARFGETLADAIKGDTSGNYKKCLLALIGEES